MRNEVAWQRERESERNNGATARRGFKSHATRAVTASLARFELFSATRPRQRINAPAVCQIALSVGQIGHTSRCSALDYGNLTKSHLERIQLFWMQWLSRAVWTAINGGLWRAVLMHWFSFSLTGDSFWLIAFCCQQAARYQGEFWMKFNYAK